MVATCRLAYDGRYPHVHAFASMLKFRVVSILVMALLAAGCGDIERGKKDMALESTLSGYRSALRWGYYETAWSYLHPDLRDGSLEVDWAGRVRVVGYDVVQSPVMIDEATVSQVVQINYVDEDVQRMHGLVDRQVWRYAPDEHRWWLYSGLPAFE